MQAQILGLLTPLMALLFAATFAVLWRVGRLNRYVLGFGIGYLFFAAGYLLTHFLPGDAFYTFHATQVFYTIGVVFFAASTSFFAALAFSFSFRCDSFNCRSSAALACSRWYCRTFSS